MVVIVLFDNGFEVVDLLIMLGFVGWFECVGYCCDFDMLGEKGSYVFIGFDFV